MKRLDITAEADLDIEPIYLLIVDHEAAAAVVCGLCPWLHDPVLKQRMPGRRK